MFWAYNNLQSQNYSPSPQRFKHSPIPTQTRPPHQFFDCSNSLWTRWYLPATKRHIHRKRFLRFHDHEHEHVRFVQVVEGRKTSDNWAKRVEGLWHQTETLHPEPVRVSCCEIFLIASQKFSSGPRTLVNSLRVEKHWSSPTHSQSRGDSRVQ